MIKMVSASWVREEYMFSSFPCPSKSYHNFFSFLFPSSFPSASLTPSSLWSTAGISSVWHCEAERGITELLLLLRQREAEQNVAELADMGDGVSTSLSGPELEVGDGGGKEEETEGWKRRLFKVQPLSCHCHMCVCLFFGLLRFCVCSPVMRCWTCWSSL